MQKEVQRRDDQVPTWVMFVLALAIIAGASGAVVFGLAASLGWQQSLVVIVGATAIAGGIVFSVLEMQGLGKRAR